MSYDYEQLALLDEGKKGREGSSEDYLVDTFSADGFCSDISRKALEAKYAPKLEVTEKFNRQSVSYQLSKKDILHSWLKYKEGYSAQLVNHLLDEMNVREGGTVLDPFLGSGTTGLVCQMRNINSIGYDILPLSSIAIKAKADVMEYDIRELVSMLDAVRQLTMPTTYEKRTPYITITKDAYPENNQKYIQYISDWRDGSAFSNSAKNLLTLCIVNSLEQSSYTTKNGQYLGWDYRSPKVERANQKRISKGKKPFSRKMVRENIGDVKEEIQAELQHIINDIRLIQLKKSDRHTAKISYIQGSVLQELPKLRSNSIDGVITSPPYCNRYDYTRTYALELVYLGLNEQDIKDLRQRLLSSTVESKSKISQLEQYYQSIGEESRFHYISKIVKKNDVLNEIMNALLLRERHGDLNNSGIIRMVEGYFTELAFVYAELFRVCKRGSIVSFVNDDVRYGGEVIPVDFLSSLFAEQLGFTVKKIYCLKQTKGNSSQQMAKFGRVPLRKSITLWLKE